MTTNELVAKAVGDLVAAGVEHTEAKDNIEYLASAYAPGSEGFSLGVHTLLGDTREANEDSGSLWVGVVKACRSIKQHWGKESIGIPTPALPELSDKLCGWRGLVFLSSKPGIGKTSLAFHAMLDAVQSDDSVAGVMLSYEMSREEMSKRLLCMISGLSFRDLSLGQGSAREKFARVSETLDEYKSALKKILFIDADMVPRFKTNPNGTLNDPFWEINEKVTEFRLQTNTSRPFVIVDYMQALPVCTPEGHMDWRSDMDRDRYTIAGLNRMQEKLGTDNPVVVISEQRKDSYDKPGSMASILGTGRASYSADAIIVLDEVEEEDRAMALQEADIAADSLVMTEKETLLNARIVKGRDGMIRGKTLLVFNYANTTYREAKPLEISLP
jgi:KaiC/GvpD/RAD55 family RecA-like ATPase